MKIISPFLVIFALSACSIMDSEITIEQASYQYVSTYGEPDYSLTSGDDRIKFCHMIWISNNIEVVFVNSSYDSYKGWMFLSKNNL